MMCFATLMSVTAVVKVHSSSFYC